VPDQVELIPHVDRFATTWRGCACCWTGRRPVCSVVCTCCRSPARWTARTRGAG